MSASDNLQPNQFKKQQRKMAVEYPDSGVTFCNKCHKNYSEKYPDKLPDTEPRVVYNHEFEKGDMLICSGGCGKNIQGRKKDYDGVD